MSVDKTFYPRLKDMQRLGNAAERAEYHAVAAHQDASARVTTREALTDRRGYDAEFLGDVSVPLPIPVGERAEDVTPVEGSPDNRLDYTHFSIVMSRSRRLAIFTALNIDGSRWVDVPRSNDRWAYDGRIPVELQVGEALYANNPLDRGHLVRRTAPNWGDEAEQANSDTFHFTNCSPQMAGFNQQTWLGLENYLLENTRDDNSRTTVFTGPVFSDNDQVYRGVQIPAAFWKVVAFIRADGRPSATAYMIEQGDLLGQLGFMFGQYKTYQRSVAHIEALAQLDFGQLSNYDGFSNEERATDTRIETELRSLDDIRV
ncbi:DNA/RNA non-specific endonuclease [Phytohalomonas tamaricis]|uniref:DNA/RNA non-specific endonuclease n=1 Tax=Phytohalomonas tamaricis TaxID=2081032 RepID=UPI000D0ADF93|nr:DNA/RNA non-specific endonuclease [Phytohalomonas tamaricis]